MYLLEGMAVPWPIEIPLWLCGHLLHRGVVTYWHAVLFTWAATSLGNLIAFVVARQGGRPLLQWVAQRFGMQAEVQRAEGWMTRYGLGTIIFTRWINWCFGLSLWLVGFSDISPARALLTMLINNALWAVAWVALGLGLARGLSHVGLPGWFILIPGGVILVGLGAWRLIRKLRPQEAN